MDLISDAQLNSIWRVRLAHLPTPIEPLPNLTRILDGPEIWVKRDDQTGLATGGNKTRKLEYLMAEALEAGADCVITAGSTQSNHARQTAAAARKCGMVPHLVLYSPGAVPAQPVGNVLLDMMLGAVIHWTDEHSPYSKSIKRVTAELKAAGKSPHVIPYGGSNSTGLLGYASAMLEAAGQFERSGNFDVHVFATSSGGTHAGMMLGAHLAGIEDKTSVLGISVEDPLSELAPRVAALANEGAARLGLDWHVTADDVAADDSYLGGGYAVVGDLEREAVRLLAEHEGLLVDPVYTGRAFGGMVDLIRRGKLKKGMRVLFWHTGGAAALFAFADKLTT